MLFCQKIFFLSAVLFFCDKIILVKYKEDDNFYVWLVFVKSAWNF